MGLNSSDWGNIAGAVVGAYSPQAGSAVQSIFTKPKAPTPPPATLQTPPPTTAATVPMYVWIGGGVAVVLVVVLLATRR